MQLNKKSSVASVPQTYRDSVSADEAGQAAAAVPD